MQNSDDLLLDMITPLHKVISVRRFFADFKFVMKKFNIDGISSVQFKETEGNNIFVKNIINNRFFCPLVKAGSIALDRKYHQPLLFGLHPDDIKKNKDGTDFVVDILSPKLNVKTMKLKTLENIMSHNISRQQLTNIVNHSIKN